MNVLMSGNSACIGHVLTFDKKCCQIFNYRLRGLHGDLLSFPSEPNSTWCGEPGGTCFKCTDDSPDPRQLCMHRLVSARMVAPLSKLAKLVQAEWQGGI